MTFDLEAKSMYTFKEIGLVWFYGISTIVSYSMPNSFLCI